MASPGWRAAINFPQERGLNLPSCIPLPHTEHCLLRQRVAHLAGQHADLAAMMRVVRNQIAEKSGDVGAESFYSTTALQRGLQYRAESFPALFEGSYRLHRRDPGTIQLFGNFASLGGSLEPHDADVVQ